MSADNYYIIRKHPSGGFAAVMGFASDDRTPKARNRHQPFATVKAALDYAHGHYTEYGVSVHPEVREARRAEVERLVRGKWLRQKMRRLGFTVTP